MGFINQLITGGKHHPATTQDGAGAAPPSGPWEKMEQMCFFA